MKSSTWVLSSLLVLSGCAVCAWLVQPDASETWLLETGASGHVDRPVEATSANPPAQLHDDGAAEHSTPDPARPPTADAETKNEAAQRRAGERHAQLAAAAGEKGTLRGKPGAWRPVLEIRDPAGFVFELEAGTRPPVVLLAGGPDLSPAQAQAVERIATDFSKEVQRASTQSTDDAGLAQAWDDARKRADERYHILIGNDAYLQASIRAMRETWQLSGAR